MGGEYNTERAGNGKATSNSLCKLKANENVGGLGVVYECFLFFIKSNFFGAIKE